jgi:ATP-dependent DNA ligase
MVRFIARAMQGAKTAPYPGFVPFCNPTLKAEVPTGAGWLYEIKFDGYRCQLHLNAGKAKAYSRNGNDFTRDFAPICAAAQRIAAKSIIIDGEVIVPDADGRPDFSALRSAIGKPAALLRVRSAGHASGTTTSPVIRLRTSKREPRDRLRPALGTLRVAS